MTNAILNVVSSAVAYGDPSQTSNPRLRYFDWSRQHMGLSVGNPRGEQFVVLPGETKSVFDGTRELTIAGPPAIPDGGWNSGGGWPYDISSETLITLEEVQMAPSHYRFKHAAGQDPSFAERGPTIPAETVVYVNVSKNGLATFSFYTAPADLGVRPGGVVTQPQTTFAAYTAPVVVEARVGDLLFIPGVLDGNTTSPFNPINYGSWRIVSVTPYTLQAVRLEGQPFEGTPNAVCLASEEDMLLYRHTNVFPGDKLQVVSGFSESALRTYEVADVRPEWIEVVSTTPLPTELGVAPGPGGMIVYANAKRFIRVETDQEAAVQVNGDTSLCQRMSPIVAGEGIQSARYERFGPTWSLRIVNLSSAPLRANILTAE